MGTNRDPSTAADTVHPGSVLHENLQAKPSRENGAKQNFASPSRESPHLTIAQHKDCGERLEVDHLGEKKGLFRGQPT